MRCYNCGCDLAEYNFCTNCGADVGQYKRIIRTSNFFYNKGLESARVRDLSGAVVNLRESLKFNKNNIKARNLLGLVYFETGEVAAALSEWVISMNLRSKKNVASDYVERVQSNAKKLDTISQSIKKYNKALEYCHQPDGVDMAIIQLKSVISQTPNFVRAHLLLSLCYFKTGRPDLAKKEAQRVLTIDVTNTTALRYVREADAILTPVDEPKKKGKDKEEDKSGSVTYTRDNETIIQPLGIKEKKGSNTILNIIFGVAIGLAIAFFLVLPARIQAAKREAQETVKSYGTQLDAKNITINELESKVSEQNDRIAALTETLNAYNGTEGTLKSMESLLKAASIYLNDPEAYLEVADYITEVDETKWTEDTSENYKNLYYAIKEAIGPNVCISYLSEGTKAYKNKEYDDAIAYLENAVFFDATNADALYQLALTYEANEKKDDAKLAYNKIQELFPDTWLAAKAKKAVEAMQ